MSLIDYNNIDIYQEDNLVLKDVNFQVEEGEFIYIIGKVGSGKTSLLKTLYCELDLYKDAEKDEQKAEVLGRDMLTLKRKEVPALRRELGIIFQDFKLLHEKSVRKNLEFVLKSTGWKNEQEISALRQHFLMWACWIRSINIHMNYREESSNVLLLHEQF